MSLPVMDSTSPLDSTPPGQQADGAPPTGMLSCSVTTSVPGSVDFDAELAIGVLEIVLSGFTFHFVVSSFFSSKWYFCCKKHLFSLYSWLWKGLQSWATLPNPTPLPAIFPCKVHNLTKETF